MESLPRDLTSEWQRATTRQQYLYLITQVSRNRTLNATILQGFIRNLSTQTVRNFGHTGPLIVRRRQHKLERCREHELYTGSLVQCALHRVHIRYWLDCHGGRNRVWRRPIAKTLNGNGVVHVRIIQWSLANS